jgi:hypothetical protein
MDFPIRKEASVVFIELISFICGGFELDQILPMGGGIAAALAYLDAAGDVSGL